MLDKDAQNTMNPVLLGTMTDSLRAHANLYELLIQYRVTAKQDINSDLADVYSEKKYMVRKDIAERAQNELVDVSTQ